MQYEPFLFVLEIDSACGAEFLTGAAFALLEIDAGLLVYDIFQGDGLLIGDVDGLSLYELFVVFIIHLLGTLFKTGTASNTLVHIHKARMLKDLHLKTALFTMDAHNFRKGHQFNVEMPADLDQFGRDDSHGTVIGGECLVQL
jgi:hypothetical protein